MNNASIQEREQWNIKYCFFKIIDVVILASYFALSKYYLTFMYCMRIYVHMFLYLKSDVGNFKLSIPYVCSCNIQSYSTSTNKRTATYY